MRLNTGRAYGDDLGNFQISRILGSLRLDRLLF